MGPKLQKRSSAPRRARKQETVEELWHAYKVASANQAPGIIHAIGALGVDDVSQMHEATKKLVEIGSEKEENVREDDPALRRVAREVLLRKIALGLFTTDRHRLTEGSLFSAYDAMMFFMEDEKHRSCTGQDLELFKRFVRWFVNTQSSVQMPNGAQLTPGQLVRVCLTIDWVEPILTMPCLRLAAPRILFPMLFAESGEEDVLEAESCWLRTGLTRWDTEECACFWNDARRIMITCGKIVQRYEATRMPNDVERIEPLRARAALLLQLVAHRAADIAASGKDVIA